VKRYQFTADWRFSAEGSVDALIKCRTYIDELIKRQQTGGWDKSKFLSGDFDLWGPYEDDTPILKRDVEKAEAEERKKMIDADVGKLWRKYNSYTPSSDGGEAEACMAVEELIRKLVDERREHFDEAIETTLKGFGIDPKTWK